jgi:hypothetical protein
MKRFSLALIVAVALSALLVAGAAAKSPRGGSGTPPAPAEVPLATASGTPPMTADDGHGYYLWFDGDRFQLRTTDRGNGPESSIYTGQITTDGTFSRVDVFKDEDTDWAIAGPHQIDFHFRTYNGQDGVAFHADGGSRVTFRLYRDGHLIGTEHIFIGPGQVNPPSNPFAIVN